MALSYSFSNLCGAPYEGGNVSFTPDGSSLASPCGNRVSIFDLQHTKVVTLPFEARQNIKHLIFATGTPLLLTIDETGVVSDAKFSPCGKYFAVAIDRKLKIWDTPTAITGWQLSLRREIRQHLDQIVHIDWSINSNFIVTASRDLTVKIFSRDPIDGFTPTTFVDHRYPLRAAFFTKDMQRIISISRDGFMISWRWVPSWEARNEEGERLRNHGFEFTQWRTKSSVKNEDGIKSEEDEGKRQKKRRKMSTGSSDQDIGVDGTSDSESSSLIDKSSELPTFIDGTWTLENKVICNTSHSARVARCSYHVQNGLLVVGFSNGVMSLYQSPSFDALYTLSIGTDPLDSVAINADGEWLAMASSQLGQLAVWEWRSETYLLKQQGHKTGIRCVATAPVIDSASTARGLDGRSNALGLGQRNLIVATGGEDGKIKLWDTDSGFNFMTFAEHTAAVNDVVFTPQGNAVLSASSDGSVRAFDLTRYRNFRTFTSTLPGVQFVAVAVDGGGEIVVAGCQGAEYSVLVWSIQTGKLLEKLSGHEAPVVSVQFHPHPSKPGVLLSGSWDSTVRVWDVFGRAGKGGASEPLINTSGVLSVAFDPRANNQIAAATLSGNIWIWDSEEGRILGSIDGLRDIHSGRRVGDKFTANNSRAIKKKDNAYGSVGSGVNQNQHFSSVAYSSNGLWILASAKTSARVCVYDTDKRVLLHTFQLTRNLSLDGILLELNSKHVNETGYAIQEFDLSDSEDNDGEVTRRQRRVQQHLALPGAQQGDFKGSRKSRQLNCWQVCFAQNGQHWCAATSHGLFIYTVDHHVGQQPYRISVIVFSQGGSVMGHSTNHVSQGQLDRFAPNLITRNVTPQNIDDALNSDEYSRAMILALALNDFYLLNRVYSSIPYKSIRIVVQSIPPLLVPALLNFLRVCLSSVVKVVKLPAKSDGQTMLPVGGGNPHLQYHLHWLTSLFTSSHLASLQQIDVNLLETEANVQSEGLISQCGISTSNLRTLCLLLLRNIQRLHSSLSSSFGSNLRSLDFILSSKKPIDSATVPGCC